MANRIPYVAPEPSTTAPSEPTVIAVVIICALSSEFEGESAKAVGNDQPGVVNRTDQRNLTGHIRPPSDPTS